MVFMHVQNSLKSPLGAMKSLNLFGTILIVLQALKRKYSHIKARLFEAGLTLILGENYAEKSYTFAW